VESDGVIEYDPKDGAVILQEALAVHQELTWTRTKIAPPTEEVTTSAQTLNAGQKITGPEMDDPNRMLNWMWMLLVSGIGSVMLGGLTAKRKMKK